MFIEQAQEPQLPQHSGGYGRVHVTRPGIPPRPPAVVGRCTGASLIETASAKFVEPSPWTLPLSPDHAAQLAAKPLVEILETRLDLREPKVHHPASGREVEVRHDGGETSASPLAQHAAQLRLQPLDGRWRDPQAHCPVPRHTVAKEFTTPRPCDAAFVPIHAQSESLAEPALQRCQHPLARRLRPYVHVTVVRVSDKVVPAPFQLSVPFVEQNVTEKWREGSALRRALRARRHQPIRHHPRL